MVDAPSRPCWSQIQARARAAFLGLAVGDALGATTEFMTPQEIRDRYGVHRRMIGGGWLHLEPGRVTDDTEMSIYLARGILSTGRWDLKVIADHFVSWMRSPPVDIGATCARGIRGYLHKGTLEAPPNEWDAGNGAVMRVLPVALYTLGDAPLLATCAVQQARITHNHPLSDQAGVCVGRMVQRGLLKGEAADLQTVAGDLVRDLPLFRYRPYRGNSSPYVVDTLQTVFHFLFTTSTFEDCLTGVVNQGGDADTTGAIAGMIAGAFYGPSAIPRRWSRKLHPATRREVEELAVRLVNLSPLGTALRHG